MSDTGIGAIVSEELNDTKKAVQKAINNTIAPGNPIAVTPQQQDQKIADLKADDERKKTEELERIGRELNIIRGNETPEETQRKLAEVKKMVNEHHQNAEKLGIAKPDQQNIPSGPEIQPAKVISAPIDNTSKLEKPPLTKQQELNLAGTREGKGSSRE